MPTMSMPDRPNLESFRRQARVLQRAVRAGDPAGLARVARHHPGGAQDDPATFPLAAAHLVVALEYGFASWPRLRRYLDVVAEHGWDSAVAAARATDPTMIAKPCSALMTEFTANEGLGSRGRYCRQATN